MGRRPCVGGLGDVIEKGLNAIGVTEERVQRWFGECGCKERKRRLNNLSQWAIQFFTGKSEETPDTSTAKEQFAKMVGDVVEQPAAVEESADATDGEEKAHLSSPPSLSQPGSTSDSP